MTEATGRDRSPEIDADELLVVRCQLGERAAFDDLIDRWHLRLWRFARRLTGNDEAADDVTQDVWLRVLRGIGRLRDGTKLRAWMFGIARRVLIDRLRARYAAPVLSSLASDVIAVPDEDDAGDVIALIEQGLDQLPVIDREVLVLFYLEELALVDVADIVGVPVGTVKSRLHRARRTLRQQLIAQGVTP